MARLDQSGTLSKSPTDSHHGPATTEPLRSLDAKEQRVTAAVRAALEQRRIAMMIRNGIDLTSGTRMTTPTKPASKIIKPVFTPATQQQISAEKQRRIAELAARGMTLAEAKARLGRE